MKVKKCTGEGCTYEGSMYQSKPILCKNCAMKAKSDQPKTYVKVASSKPKSAPKKPSNSLEDKSIPELIKLATIVFNRWIKRRDAGTIGTNCISCGNWYPVSELQAGHFMPSTYSSLRFNEYNVSCECEKCNCMDDSHLKFYRINLIKKIGLEKVEELESTPIAAYFKWDREELLNIIEKYK